MKEGSSVTIFYSRGRETVEFGDYTGRMFETVKTELLEQGFVNVRPFYEESDQPIGEILEHDSPRVGEQVIPEDNTVYFIVSSGPPMIEVPSLTGMTRSEAVAELEGMGLEVEIEEDYSDRWPVNQVASQSPQPGEEVEEGATISLTISLGAEPAPEPEPEPEPEPDPQPRTETVQVQVPFDEESGEAEQQVLIYVGDADNKIGEVFREETITETTTYEIPLTITPGEEASYKVQRGEQVVEEDTLTYEEVGENNP